MSADLPLGSSGVVYLAFCECELATEVPMADSRTATPPAVADRPGPSSKGSGDCGDHEWYKSSGEEDRCYHCTAGIRPPSQFSERS